MSLVDENAATTMANIAGSSVLFRAGLSADILMIALDVAVAVGLYTLLRHVHQPLALLGFAFRMLQAAVLGANLMNMANALSWATGAALATHPGMAETLVLSSMQLHAFVYDIGLVFFGLACVVLGHLFRVSRLVPLILGVGLSVAGVVYLCGSFVVILTPEVASIFEPMYGLTVLAELAFAGWLVIRGVLEVPGTGPGSAPRPEREQAL
jgi:hypothetical protein